MKYKFSQINLTEINLKVNLHNWTFVKIMFDINNVLDKLNFNL